MQENNIRIRKSVKLSDTEKKEFKKWVSKFHTQVDASDALGVTHPTIGRVLLTGTCHQTTVEKIRKVIPQEA